MTNEELNTALYQKMFAEQEKYSCRCSYLFDCTHSMFLLWNLLFQ